MLKFNFVLIFILLLQGCSAITSLPSFQYCDNVEYIRKDARISIKADCRAPLGGSIL